MKNKRVLLIVLAVAVLIVLFFVKAKSKYENDGRIPGLVTGEETLAEVVNKDTDKDGVLDWEESLWGTDPTKRDTNGDGTDDGVEIAKMKSEHIAYSDPESSTNEENLTETDKLSRELFSSVVALNQSGEIDPATADKLSETIAQQIQNPTPRKVFVISEIKTTADNSPAAMQSYLNAINNINKKYPQEQNAMEVLQEFVGDGETENIAALEKLGPIITEASKVIDELAKISVPSELAELHLNFINVLEQLAENLTDIQMFNEDPIVAMGAIGQYEANTAILESATGELGAVITKKLNN